MDDLFVEREQHNQKNAQWKNAPDSGAFRLPEKLDMRLIYLSDKFYEKYGKYPEILKKDSRPYACLEVEIDGRTYAIPLRHHITHKYAFLTIGNQGLDYTKAVVIDDDEYISSLPAWIDSAEFAIIKNRESVIANGMKKYCRIYQKAVQYKDKPFYSDILKYTTLKYFDF